MNVHWHTTQETEHIRPGLLKKTNKKCLELKRSSIVPLSFFQISPKIIIPKIPIRNKSFNQMVPFVSLWRKTITTNLMCFVFLPEESLGREGCQSTMSQATCGTWSRKAPCGSGTNSKYPDFPTEPPRLTAFVSCGLNNANQAATSRDQRKFHLSLCHEPI